MKKVERLLRTKSVIEFFETKRNKKGYLRDAITALTIRITDELFILGVVEPRSRPDFFYFGKSYLIMQYYPFITDENMENIKKNTKYNIHVGSMAGGTISFIDYWFEEVNMQKFLSEL